jgi:tripartite-type tricarboxylate transporter receptor subunit TctC
MKTHLTIAALAFFTAAHAQDYPTKPIRLVVPYSPGGPVDIVGRLTAQKLTDELKQQVIVDNRAGGGGNIAVEIVARSLPDGYTLLMGANGTNAINPNLYPKLAVVPARDLVPIGMVASSPGARSTRQSEAGQHQFRLVGERLDRPPLERAFQEHGGREHRARAI